MCLYDDEEEKNKKKQNEKISIPSDFSKCLQYYFDPESPQLLPSKV